MNSLMHKVAALTWLALFLLFMTFIFTKQARAEDAWLKPLLEKESITIAVTDSGLGGLSVVADAVQKLQKNQVFKDVNLIFFNALFTNQGGYNSLPSRAAKLKVFSSALQSMQDRYSPDVILVACNTLSVIYPDTEFARTTKTPVVGIVENGVEQIAGQLSGKPSARNIIFATQTTISEGTHKRQLLDQGFAEEQIVSQPCPELTLYIEQGYDSMETELLIDAYVDEALSHVGESADPLYVSFNCTHYGYSLDAWMKAFSSRGVEVAGFLNPNTQMIDFLMPLSAWHRHKQTNIDVKVVSMTDIPADRQASIGRYLDSISPLTGKALRNFEQQADLFEWRSLLGNRVK